MSSGKDISEDGEHAKADQIPIRPTPDAHDHHQIEMDFGTQAEAEFRKRTAERPERLVKQKAQKKVVKKRDRTQAEAMPTETTSKIVDRSKKAPDNGASHESVPEPPSAPETPVRKETYVAPPASVEPPPSNTDDAHRSGIKTANKALFGILVIVACIGLGIWIFSGSDQNPKTPTVEEPGAKMPSAEVSGKEKPDGDAQSPAGTGTAEVTSLSIGDTVNKGIVFAVDASGKTGKIVYREDLGPTSWKNAVEASEKMGDGWRLPTMGELETIYQSIGQGATNGGQFADELYWSATPYETYQARLFRFSDGNTSYHYNNALPTRKFLARPVRDFER